MKRLHRALAVTGASVVSTVALSACSFLSPVQTDQHYNPGDGVPAQSGAVIARNLVVVADKTGGPGALTGGLQNTGDSEVTVKFLTPTQSRTDKQITLKGREGTSITGVTITLGKDEGPGTMTKVVMSTAAGDQTVTVPVLPATGIYATLAPKS